MNRSQLPLSFHVPADRRTTPVSPLTSRLWWPSAASATRSRLTLVSSNVAADVPMRIYATRKGDFLVTRPLTAQVVVAISDARRAVYARLASDGLDLDDERALLLLDTALYTAERADVGRRVADRIRDTAEVTRWSQRMEQELAEAFERITEMRNGQIAA